MTVKLTPKKQLHLQGTYFMFRAYIRHSDIEIGTREVAFDEILE